ncbi:MAG: DUF3995 domain-containing protein [Ilumatobacteraceae bacterium]
MTRTASTTAITLTTIAALHAVWGAGASFPFPDSAALADTVTGSGALPAPRECFAVAGLMLFAAGVVSEVLPIGPMARRIGSGGVAAVLGTRGVAGVLGRTGSLVPWTPSERFNRLDRRLYGPLCLLLAGGAAMSARR